jgi:RHS repeat-associated protein
MTSPRRNLAVYKVHRNVACILFFLLIGSGDVVLAQVTTGTPPLGSFGGGPDVINLANLNANLTVPILQKPGRGGMDFYYDLAYDTSIWYPVTVNGVQSWQPVFNWGWTAQTAVQTGYVSYRRVSANCDSPPPIPQYVIFSNFVYHDMWGVPHPFSAGLEYDPTGCDLGNTLSATAKAGDNSGLTLSVATVNGAGLTTHSVTTTKGQVTTPPLNLSNGYSGVSAASTDRNGNQISVSSTSSSATFTDTLNTAAITVAGSATSASPLTFTYSAPGGSTAYTVKFTSQTVQTKFGCSITDYGPTVNNLISEIDRPDGSKYTFTYETTPGDAHNPPYVTGRLNSVTLPTGGQITYGYTGGSTGHINCSDGSAATLTRTVTPGGVWTYAQVKGTGAASTTTVTDPQSNVTTIQFQGIHETQRQVGSLITTNTCYNGATSPCNSTAITLPITQRSIITTLGTQQSKHVDLYSSYGVPTESDDYDFGPSAPGPLIKKVLATYASLGNINAFQQLVTVCNGTSTSSACNGTGTVVSQTTYNYDESAVSSNIGTTPQHVTVSGSRGNLTSVDYPAGGLISRSTYYDTGAINATTDVNLAVNTYAYPDNISTCGNAFPTSITEPLSLTRSMTWNCIGGLQLTAKDENNQTVTTTYNDPAFWRPNIVTDQLGNQTNIAYQPNASYCCPPALLKVLAFNNNSSVSSDIQYKDAFGRTYTDQHQQYPGSPNLDTVSYTFDANGRLYSTSGPCQVGATGTCTSPTTTQTYDALNRPLVTTNAGGGTATYSYTGNDVLVTIGPAPSGENTKRRQLEYDALGRLTSVCEISSATGSGACGQNSPQTGFWTKYTYSALGVLTAVTQNAQATSGQQTRSYSYDANGRLTSESNPESGTTTYVYDVNGGCGASAGDLTKKTDANGINTCFGYDALHRVVSTQFSNSTNCKFYRYDSNPGVGWTEGNVKGRLSNAWIGNCSTGNPTASDDGFNYSARGELINIYHTTVSSGIWYNSTASYWPNGALNTLQLFTCITNCTNTTNNTAVTPLITYNADGEGRPSTVSASAGQNPVTATTYNAASLPTAVTYGSADTDALTYDPNTFRMTKYQFNVNGQAYVGALTWNPNGSLGSQVITDPFNSADAQTCSYSHDDLARIASVNCGASTWQQNFTYDTFGNITKTVPVGGTGNSFQPTYSATTNRMTSLPGFTPTYDADGNVTSDSLHTYGWDANGNSTTVDGIGLTFDAANRMVEQNRSGALTEIIYTPTGQKFALMNGVTLKQAFVPLPGTGVAVYTSAGLDHYRHSDWLGSNRLQSSPTRTVLSTFAYAPFGETYAWSGTPEKSFTGQNSDTTPGDFDFLYREYSNQGRWASPDPAGLAAVDPTTPQSWNRYSYVTNNPLRYIDPLGLVLQTVCISYGVSYGFDDGSSEGGYTQQECTTFDDGTIPLPYNNLTPPPSPVPPSVLVLWRPPTDKEYKACMANATATQQRAIATAHFEEAVGGASILAATALQFEMIPALHATIVEPVLSATTLESGAGALLEGSHSAMAFGVSASTYIPGALYFQGLADHIRADNAFFANSIACAAAIPIR